MFYIFCVFGIEYNKVIAKKIPKKFLANKSKILYNTFFTSYGKRAATPYKAQTIEKYQKVFTPSSVKTA